MPKVGKKKYPYTKKGKAAAAKAKQEQKTKKRKGPMPKVNPEFAKEMEEANKPKQKADPHKEYRERQRRGRDIQRASDAAKMKETEGDTTGADLPITRQPLSMILRRRKAGREQAAREKARQDRKKRQGTIGPAPKKKKKGERSVDVQAGQEATRSKVRKTKAPRGRKMVTKKSMRPGRFFRGRG